MYVKKKLNPISSTSDHYWRVCIHESGKRDKETQREKSLFGQLDQHMLCCFICTSYRLICIDRKIEKYTSSFNRPKSGHQNDVLATRECAYTQKNHLITMQMQLVRSNKHRQTSRFFHSLAFETNWRIKSPNRNSCAANSKKMHVIHVNIKCSRKQDNRPNQSI